MLPILLLFIAPMAILVGVVWRLLPRMKSVDAAASTNPSQHLWCRRISAGVLVVPGVVILAFMTLVFWDFYGDGPGVQPYLPYFANAAVAWKVAAILGFIFSIRASYLARWSGPDLELVAVHIVAIAFIWIAPLLPYALRTD